MVLWFLVSTRDRNVVRCYLGAHFYMLNREFIVKICTFEQQKRPQMTQMTQMLRLHHCPQFFIFCWRLQSRGGHSFTQSTFLSVSMVRTQPNRIFQGSSFLAKKVTKSRDEKAIILLLNENHRKTKYVLCWWHNQSSPNITKLPKKLPQQLFT